MRCYGNWIETSAASNQFPKTKGSILVYKRVGNMDPICLGPTLWAPTVIIAKIDSLRG